MGSTATAGSTFPSAPAGFPELYERELVKPLFEPWAEELIAAIPLSAGSDVLDVACGTGIVARLARRRVGPDARVVGVDRNAGMLAVARTVDRSIDWREGDATELPVAKSEKFNAVFCHQGVQFFPDRLAALREMRRALHPGGGIGIGVWRSLEENSLFHDLDRVAERFVGPIDDARHSFPHSDALAELLTQAGFSDVKVVERTRSTRFNVDPATMASLNAGAAVGMSAAGKAMSDAERASVIQEIVAASVPEVQRYVKEDDVVEFQTSANIASGYA